MPLESTMICLDNSEYMRNGDYLPTRFAAQQDAAGVLCNFRIRENPENTVGILSMAGQGVDLLVSPTEELSKILACFNRLKMGGNVDLTTSIQIAQLALKHRKNKNGGQRIVVFVGGVISEAVESLTKLGKQLKKNNVALDVVCVGEADENVPKLQELINATNTNENSRLVVVPAGVSAATTLQQSPIMNDGSMGAMQAGMGGDADFDMYGGIDPSMDPELAMAIRISQEEAKAAEDARVKSATAESASSSSAVGDSGAIPGFDEEEDEEALIQRALEMSMKDMEGSQPTAVASQPSSSASASAPMDAEDEDEELQRALALSMGGSTGSEEVDPDLVNQLLGGSDVSDPLIRAALEQMQSGSNNNEDNKEKDDKTKKRKSDDI